MLKQTARNGKIEWMRFVFSIVIILFHCRRTFGSSTIKLLGHSIPFMTRGYICVEFFFLVSGYLMASSICRTQERIKAKEIGHFDLGIDSFRFMKKKYWGIFPYHLFSFSVLWVLRVFTRGIFKDGVGAVVSFGIKSIPELFLLQRFGFAFTNIDVVEWYLSAMLIAMMVLYPLAFRFFSVYVRVIGPFMALWILGAMHYVNNTFSGQDAWTGFGYVCVFRAFAEMTLGMSAYVFTDYLKKQSFKFKTRVFFTIAEVLGYTVSVVYAIFGPQSYDPQILFVLWISVSLTFSGQTCFTELFQSNVVLWLGRLSLPLYLCQLIGTAFVNKYVTGPSFAVRTMIAFAIVFVMALFCQTFGDRLRAYCARVSM